MFNAFIFDLDGTLIDSEKLHFRAYRDVLRQYGAEITLKDFVYFWLASGKGMQGAFDKFGIKADPVKARAQKLDIFHQMMETEKLDLLPGVKEFLDKSKSLGKKLVVASGSKRAEIKKMLENVNITEYFDFYLSVDDAGRGKPHPDIFHLAVKNLAIPADKCLIFENASNGLISAKAAEMTCYVIPSEVTRDDYDYSDADKIFNSFFEIDCEDL